MTTTPVLYSYADKEGKRKLYIRITTGNTVAYYNTGFKLAKSNWTGKRVVNIKEAADINQTVELLCVNARSLWLEHKYDANTIKKLMGKEEELGDSPDFFEFANDYIAGIKSVGYRDSLRSKMHKMVEFCKMQPLPFSAITPLFLRQYEAYLYNRGNQAVTVAKALGTIRALCNKAVDLYVIKESPFRYKLPKFKHRNVIPLTREEVAAFENFDIERSGLPDTAKNAYYIQLFGFYTGARISDRLLLKWENIVPFSENGKKEWMISTNSKKTGEPIMVRVNERMRKIIEHYEDGRTTRRYVFPWIEADKTSEMLDKEISRCEGAINKWLRKISVLCGITKRNSTHVARHSFTSEFMSVHKSSSLAAQALGVTERTLRAAYYKRFPSSLVSDAMDVLYR